MNTPQEAIDTTSTCARKAHECRAELHDARRAEGRLFNEYELAIAREMDKWIGKTSMAETEARAKIAAAPHKAKWEEAKREVKDLEAALRLWEKSIDVGINEQKTLREEMRLTR